MAGFPQRVGTAALSVALVAGAVGAAPPATAVTCVVGSTNPTLFPAGGKGTLADPYLVDSQTALVNSNLCNNVYLLQTQNITLTGTWTPLGDYDKVVSLYDGGGYSISGLNTVASGIHAGIWGRWQWGGSIKNLTLISPSMTHNSGTSSSVGSGFFVGEVNSGTTFENIHVTNGTLNSQAGNVGGLIGNLNTPYVTISDSSVDATITATSLRDDSTVGGLVGKQGSNSLIQRSSSSGAVSASASLNSTKTGGAAGLVGYSDGRILNTYSTVDVTATNANNVGGLVGRSVCNAGDLNDSYAIGVVSGKSGSLNVGGLVGVVSSASCDQTDSVWDTDTSGQSTSAVGTGKTTAQMQTAATFTGWDTSIWSISNGSYPTFAAPGASISPTSLDLGSQGVLDGPTSASTTTLTSNGTGPLTIASPGITISGTNASEFAVDGSGTCVDNASVAVGATCTIAITFDPSSAGAKSATLTVATDAGNQIVALSGTGIASTQTVTWAPTTSIDTSTTSPSALATTSGDGVISYAVSSAGATGCTVDSSTAALTFAGAGSCAITATAAATSSYGVASTSVTFSVSLTAQPITVSAGSSTLAVYSSTSLSTSGVVGTGQVTYSVASGGSYCSISGSTLTALGAGTCTVTSSVAADSTYASATSSAITITVQLATQTVTWNPSNTSLLFTDSPVTPSVTATTNGDGAITYSVTSGSCAVNSNTGTLTYSSTGTCVVTATASSTTAYSAGAQAVTFTIVAVAPTRPTITSVAAGNESVTVAFTPPSSNGGATITGYTATASPGGATGSCSSSPCTITGLTNGTSYTVTVTSTNSAGTGAASTTSPSVTPVTTTGAVENLSVVPGDTNLAVSWIAPACLSDSSCGTLTGYEVFTSTDGTTFTQFGTSGTATSVTVTGLINGTQYDVKVRVTTSTSFKDALAQQVPATTASAPTGVTVSRLTATSASVGWTAPASDGGQAITGYTVTATSSDGGATVTSSPSSSPVTLTGLSDGKTYTVVVSATNLMGPGTDSSASAAVTMGLTAQTITAVPSSVSMTALTSILLSSSGSTGSGAKTFTVASGPCTVSGAALTATAAGTCTVTVTIAADVLTAAATSAAVSVTVNPAVQTVSWSPTTVFDMTETPATLSAATASDSGALTYSVTSAGTAGCSFSSGSTLTFTSAGTCTVQVVAGSTSTHAASTPVSLTINVGLATRSITWSPTTTLVAADSGTAASSLATISTGTGSPIYTVSSAGVSGCTVNSSSAVISFTAPGTCTIIATAPANTVYSVASSSAVSFTITSAPQTVSWSPTTALTLAESPVTFAAATGSGGGAVTYAVTSQGTSDCSVTSSSGVLTFTTPGQCLVSASAASVTGFTTGSTSATFLLSDDPSPTPAPSSSGSGSSSTPVIADNSVDPGAALSVPGNASLSIGSSSVPMTVSANAANTGLDMSMGQWEVSIAPAIAATALPLGPQGELRTTQGQTLDVSGTSYLRGTTVNIFIMSTPILIGAADVSARGDFTTTVTIPQAMSLGTHTLQIVGVNPGNETSRASLGVTVVATDSTLIVVKSPIGTQVGFIKNTAKLTKRSATSLNSLVGQIPAGSTSLRARVLMYVPKSASRNEVKLNAQRQRTVVSALRAAGYVGAIKTKTVKKKSKKASKANAITIWFSVPDTGQPTL